jgi:hypothetical protein
LTGQPPAQCAFVGAFLCGIAADDHYDWRFGSAKSNNGIGSWRISRFESIVACFPSRDFHEFVAAL